MLNTKQTPLSKFGVFYYLYKKIIMQLTKNFHLDEFVCNDGTPVPEELIPNAQRLANNLQVLRDHIGAAIYLNSAYRHPAYNKRVGGTKSSQHLKAKAADIRSNKYVPKELHKIILYLISIGKMEDGGLALYIDKDFVHYDVRGIKARW